MPWNSDLDTMFQNLGVFGFDPHRPLALGEGGIHGGSGTLLEIPGDRRVTSRARVVPLGVGKILVRWCSSKVTTALAAREGGWWTSDNMAERIFRQALAMPAANVSLAARLFANVKFEWGDMAQVVVCETLQPLRIVVGFGRPVVTQFPGANQYLALDRKELQLFLPQSQRSEAHLRILFFDKNAEFMMWWQHRMPSATRRSALLLRSPGSHAIAGYPTTVTRVPK